MSTWGDPCAMLCQLNCRDEFMGDNCKFLYAGCDGVDLKDFCPLFLVEIKTLKNGCENLTPGLPDG